MEKNQAFTKKEATCRMREERKNRQKSTNHDQRMKKTGAIKKKNVE